MILYSHGGMSGHNFANGDKVCSNYVTTNHKLRRILKDYHFGFVKMLEKIEKEINIIEKEYDKEKAIVDQQQKERLRRIRIPNGEEVLTKEEKELEKKKSKQQKEKEKNKDYEDAYEYDYNEQLIKNEKDNKIWPLETKKMKLNLN